MAMHWRIYEGIPQCGALTPCDCATVLHDDYYHREDSYDCRKKLDTYVVTYGPSYISEIYHYLDTSKILESFGERKINITSLGCGFAPDYYAIKRYIEEKNLNLEIDYLGLDNSQCWDEARPKSNDCNFVNCDLLTQFDIEDADIVFICKSFSTIHRNLNSDLFINILKEVFNKQLKNDDYVVFIDINNQDFGRDKFHTSLKSEFSSFEQYYFSGSTFTKPNWTEITSTNIIYNDNEISSSNCIKSTNKTIAFQYRK